MNTEQVLQDDENACNFHRVLEFGNAERVAVDGRSGRKRVPSASHRDQTRHQLSAVYATPSTYVLMGYRARATDAAALESTPLLVLPKNIPYYFQVICPRQRGCSEKG